MGCDIGSLPERTPYCKPKCAQFKLVVCLDEVKAQCVQCRLLHEFTVHRGQIMIGWKDAESDSVDGVKRGRS